MEPLRSEPWVPEDTFASRLRQVRHDLGLSVDEIAERVGVARPTWSTWENGRHPRNMAEVVQAIVAATGIDRDWLMWGTATDR